MLKIACVFSFKESNWVSCQKIVLNLHKSYQSCDNVRLENFNLSPDMEFPDIDNTAKNIVQFSPDVISFLDHKPHPLALLSTLSNLYADGKKPKLIFHVFGDFTLYYPSWEKLSGILQGFEVEFLVASGRQKLLMDKMFHPQNQTIVCPFPVDQKEFYPDEALRKKQRSALGLSDKDIAFIFTGRLSRQKRIKTLISIFAEEFENDEHAHLFIYGNPDSIGEPFLQQFDIDGEYFRIFYRKYMTLPEAIKKRIHFMGSVPNKDLLSAYQGADVFVNLSVHNDEDYGMSVAEAQAVGLPCILTDWGGLAGFFQSEEPESVKFIPVKIGRTSKRISLVYAKKALRDFYQNPRREKRQHIAELAIKNLGLKKNTEIIQTVLHKKTATFGGFSQLFYEATLPNKLKTFDSIYTDKKGNINALYRKIYSSYVRTDN